jgi:HEAT repeat protein
MRRFIALAVGILVLSLVSSPAHAQKKAKIEDLLKELDSKDAGVRTTALREIGEMAAVKLKWAQMALPQIRGMLTKDTDPKMRAAALTCLGKVEADVKDYVPNMMKVLKDDKDFGVQNTALGLLALYQQDAAPAIKPLQDRLLELREANKDQDPGNIRSNILNTIVQIDQNQSMPSSLEALEKDPAISVKLTGVNRLAQIGQQNPAGSKPAAPHLIKALAESLKAGPNADLRRSILVALSFIEPKPKSYMEHLLETLKKDRDAATVVVVIAALGRADEPSKEAIPLVLEAHKAAVAAAPKDGSDPNGQRRQIVENLGKMGIEPKDLVPVLIDTLKKDRDLGVRAAALGSIAGLGDKAKEAIPTVAAMAKSNAAVGFKDGNDPGDLRRITLEALAKLGVEPKELVTFLSDSVRRDKNPAVRLTAVKLLGDMGPNGKSALTLLASLQKLPKTANEQDKALAKAAMDAAAKIQAK